MTNPAETPISGEWRQELAAFLYDLAFDAEDVAADLVGGPRNRKLAEAKDCRRWAAALSIPAPPSTEPREEPFSTVEGVDLLRPITWQDVRLAVGEGKLEAVDVFAGANAELRRRQHLALARSASRSGDRVEGE